MSSPSSSLISTLFQQSLTDLIKLLRQNTPISPSLLTQTLSSIKHELKSTDPETKATALLKLTYLSTTHFIPISFAAFHVVEVISYPHFPYKKIGYSAAVTSFNSNTDVILLLTNQIRKDLASRNEFEVGLALQFLAVVGNSDLCRDLCEDVFGLMGSGREYVRRKAIGVLVRVFEVYPDAVRVCFKRLVEGLESSDVGTLSAAVGVFCELTGKEDPRVYLPLAPEFYRVLVDCKNNWVLIKVVKIFAKLAPLERRLADKVVEPICDVMRRTMAKSLMFECVRTVVGSFGEYESAMKLAVLKIRELLVDDDPNLKYLGLEALSSVALRHLWAVIENKAVVIKSLSDPDPNIRSASLRLVMLMVSEDNVAEISRVLITYALKSDPVFCNEILGSILATCSQNYYEVVFDFDWYVSLLGEMTRIPHCDRGEEIEIQLIDIGMRVKDARAELVRVARDLLIDPALLGNPFLHRILCAAAWVSGEYAELSNNPPELLEALLQPRTNLLPPSIRAVYIQSLFKVLVYVLHSYLSRHEGDSVPLIAYDSGGTIAADPEYVCPEGSNSAAILPSYQPFEDETQGESSMPKTKDLKHESIANLLSLVEVALVPLSWSLDVEVQERARNVLGLIDLVKEEFVGDSTQKVERTHNKIESQTMKVVEYIYNSCSEELGPVSATAQARVTLPDGLVLEENLNALDIICGDTKLPATSLFSLGGRHPKEEEEGSFPDLHSNEDMEHSTESTSLLAEHRKRHGLYYLPSEKDDALNSEYPPANEGSSSQNDGVNDLVKLTEESLMIKKKKGHAKLRPMVVRLGEGEEVHSTSNKQRSQDDLISSAVREILVGKDGEGKERASSKGKEKEKSTVDHPVDSRGSSTNVEESNLEIPHSKSKHRSHNHHHHGKERRHKSHSKNEEKREENGGDEKLKKKHHHKSRHKAPTLQDNRQSIVVNPPVIPDLLL